MVAVAAEGPIRADAVPAAAGRVDAAGTGREEEVGEFKSDVRKLEELFKKLNPSAEEFVPLSRRCGDGARRLSADAPVFVSPAIDHYAHHPVQQQQQQMHVLQLVGAGGGGVGRDSSSDGSANGQPNRRRRNCFNQGRRMGGRPRQADRECSVRRTIYVSDIDQHVTEQKLAEVFSNCGQVFGAMNI